MSRLSVAKLRQSLAKAVPAPAYYIHGTEPLLKDTALGLILDRALDPGTRDFNLDTLSAQQLDPGELPGACAVLPMMAEHRVVVVRDIEAWKRKSKGKAPAVQYLERPVPECVLVMIQGNDDDPDEELASRATAVACAPLIGEQLDEWLDGELQRAGVVLTPEAREHLLRATNGALTVLATEIQKLSAITRSEPLDAETVGALVGVRFGETADDWRDAVLTDDTARALAILPRLLEVSGTSGVSLVALLGTSLLVMEWARLTADRKKSDGRGMAQAISSGILFPLRLRVGSYQPFAQLVSAQLKHWPLPRLCQAIRAALDADLKLKASTISDETGIMTDLVLGLAMSKARRAA